MWLRPVAGWLGPVDPRPARPARVGAAPLSLGTLDDLDRALAVQGALQRAAVFRDALQLDGLPFDRRVASLGQPQPHPWGLGVQEVRFEGLQVLGLPRATWRHRVHRAWTCAFETKLWLAEGSEANLGAVCEVLKPQLGEPAVLPRSGYHWVRWDLGLMHVEARALAAGTSTAHNPMLRNHPTLLTAVDVEVGSRLRTANVQAAVPEWLAASEELGVEPAACTVHPDLLELHPSAWGEQPTEVEGCRVWRTDAHFGISLPRVSMVERSRDLRVRHLALAPARGRGYATVTVEAGRLAITVESSDDHTALGQHARRLADRLDVPLVEVAGVDD